MILQMWIKDYKKQWFFNCWCFKQYLYTCCLLKCVVKNKNHGLRPHIKLKKKSRLLCLLCFTKTLLFPLFTKTFSSRYYHSLCLLSKYVPKFLLPVIITLLTLLLTHISEIGSRLSLSLAHRMPPIAHCRSVFVIVRHRHG